MQQDSLGNRSESEDKEEIDEGRGGIRINQRYSPDTPF